MTSGAFILPGVKHATTPHGRHLLCSLPFVCGFQAPPSRPEFAPTLSLHCAAWLNWRASLPTLTSSPGSWPWTPCTGCTLLAWQLTSQEYPTYYLMTYPGCGLRIHMLFPRHWSAFQ